jgi:DNA-binding transcriptional LysR family regulator
VTLELTTSERNGLLTSLGNGELDVVVSTVHAFPQEGLSEDPLYEQPFVVFASASHQLAKRKQVTLADLAQERWALTPAGNFPQRRLGQLFEKSELPPPSIAVETTNLASITHLVAASKLLGFTSKQTVQYAATHIPIAEVRVKDLSVTRRIGVIHRKDAYLSPAARRFIEILKTTARRATKDQ